MKIRGHVKFYDASKGFGSVIRDDAGPDVFIGARAARESGAGELAPGDVVDFDLRTFPDGRTGAVEIEMVARAAIVTRVGGGW